MVPNDCFLGLINVYEFYGVEDSAGLHHSTGPGAWAFTYNNDHLPQQIMEFKQMTIFLSTTVLIVSNYAPSTTVCLSIDLNRASTLCKTHLNTRHRSNSTKCGHQC